MSKPLRLIIAAILVLLLGGGLFWYFKTQNPKKGLVQKEISIQEAGIGSDNFLTHENFAGFSFEYPDNFTLKETELDNSAVYAAIELTAPNGDMINLRVYDDSFNDVDAWIADFEKNNVIVDLTGVLWADLEGKSFAAGSPQKLYSVTVDNGVVYKLESPMNSTLMQDVHNRIISSFKFSEATPAEATTEAPEESTDENITLIEEIIQ